MANVKNPFFSTFATGSIGKKITCYPRYNGNKFVIQKYKSRAGKRHQIQIENSKIFTIRAKAMSKLLKIIKEEQKV